MQRLILDAALPLPPARSVASQTRPPAARHNRQTQTEPRFCLSCHAAQLAELLQPGRAGRTPARQDDFASRDLSPVEERDEPFEPPEPPEPTTVAVAVPPPARTPGQRLAASLLGPDGRPMPHVLRKPDLLWLLLRVSPQSLTAGRTAE